MDSDEEGYNLRGRKRSRRSQPGKKLMQGIFKNKKRRRTRKPSGEDNNYDNASFTKDGYVEDGFVIDDPHYTDNIEDKENPYFDLDSKPIQEDIINRMVESGDIDREEAKTIVYDAFKGTGEYLVQDYTSCKPSTDHWKLGLSDSKIKAIEPELGQIRIMMEEETPTIPKILQSNITTDDKKRCIVLFDQLNNTEPYTPEHYKLQETINNIIRKGKRHTKAEIQRLESIENRLKRIAAPPDNLKNQILLLDADEKTKGIIYGQYLEMLEHEPGSQAFNSIREEIEWSVRLPHNRSHDTQDLSGLTNTELNDRYQEILEGLDEELHGMENIKMKMLHIINDRRSSNNGCGRNIAITGPPGTGKTAIGKALAKVLEVPFEKISVGGMEDSAILKGSNKVWNSAEPSIVLQILSRMKSSSGVVMFDEIDKLGGTEKGKTVQYALLHISDYVHNKEFQDLYLDKYSHDLSKVLFIFIMNSPDALDSAFRNRLDIIETQPYTTEEKMEITQYYVLPRALKAVDMDPESVTINDKASNKIVMATREDDGCRTIEKAVKSLVGKTNMYRSIVLPDGTTGDIDLGYVIPNFKLPLVIGPKLLINLTKDIVHY